MLQRSSQSRHGFVFSKCQPPSRLESHQMTEASQATVASIQTALAVGVPSLAVLVGILINNTLLNDLRGHMDARFDDLRETLRSELRRVESL
jgi:hypothetical protein